jgi:hypothetical protein
MYPKFTKTQMSDKQRRVQTDIHVYTFGSWCRVPGLMQSYQCMNQTLTEVGARTLQGVPI